MKIRDVLSFFNIVKDDDREVKEIYDDSRLVTKNSIFIAISKGNNYIEEAITNGAIIVISDDLKNNYYVSELKEKLLPFCLFFYGHIENKIKLIGVTGTNGKSTSAYLIHSMLKSSLLITTTSGIKNSFISKNTTPYPLEFIKALKKAIKKKYKYLIMEISSIGISEGRLNGLNFEKILLTNITSDHLDYHKNLNEYQNTKVNYLLKSDSFIYLPVDCFVRFPLLRKVDRFELYSEKEVEIISENEIGTLFLYKHNLFKTNLIGILNIRNIVGVLTMLSSLCSLRRLKRKLRKILPLKGRMNVVNRNPLVIIDYAHTVIALESLLKDAINFNRKKIIVVFGAGGNRDSSKRREYGKIVENYGDIGIVTSDNPRDEDADKIIDEIIGDSGFYFIRCPDRSKAIRQAFKYASKDDCILIVGKGAEVVQIVKGKNNHFSDFEEVRKCLKKH